MIERAPAHRQYGGGNEGGFAMATLRPTATTVFDSILFRDAFGTPRMREIFFRSRPYLALRGGRDRSGACPGPLRCHPRRSSGADCREIECCIARLRPFTPGDRHRRLY